MTRIITFRIEDHHPSGGRTCKTSFEGYAPDDTVMADLVAALAHLCLASSGAKGAPETLTAIYARAMELLQPENHATVRRQS